MAAAVKITGVGGQGSCGIKSQGSLAGLTLKYLEFRALTSLVDLDPLPDESVARAILYDVRRRTTFLLDLILSLNYPESQEQGHRPATTIGRLSGNPTACLSTHVAHLSCSKFCHCHPDSTKTRGGVEV